MLAVSGVDVDQLLSLAENPMTELTALVVVHGAQQNDLFTNLCAVIIPGSPDLRCQKLPQLLLSFDKRGQIFRLHAKHCGVSLRQDLRLVFAQISRREILPDEIFGFNHVSVADDEAYGPVKGVQQPVKMRRGVSAGSAGTQHDDFDGTAL
ncbi:hypothetical protein SDC9_205546 [bioreactor metagenome]|uniref:Uncharacterized protein n=1 Tax=bioreactor metagenome TaxID=1076179 RepID=A0A645J3Z8_9ZZZZ